MGPSSLGDPNQPMTDDPNDQPAHDPLEDTQPFSDTEPDDEAFDDEGEAAVEPEPRPAHGATRRGETHRAAIGPSGPAGRARTRGVTIDPSLRIRDRVSEWFVIGTVLIFTAIFLNALAFGHGGALSPSPTALPSVEASFGPTATPEPTPVPIQTPFSVPTPTAGPSESPTEAPTAAPSEAPTAAPSSS
jgi:hypothetical protein